MLRERRITPLELAEEYIRAIERWNPVLNAIIDYDPEHIREQARNLEHSTSGQGSLAGLPMTIKSSIPVAGRRCSIGSRLRQHSVSTNDAVVVARLRTAGVNFLGGTNCPEFLMAYESDNLLHGRTSNPWNPDATAGGSSGGESAAIAAGLSAAGLGSDSGGSVRVPAHFTGICSLKPTPGRIPAFDHEPPCYGPFSILGAIGPMARTMADVSLLFATISGQWAEDPAGSPVPLRSWSLQELKQTPIGYFEDDGIVPVTPETRQAVQAAVRSLQDCGFDVRPFRPSGLEAARQLWWKFFVRGGAMLVRSIVGGNEPLLSPVLQEFLAIAAQEPPLGGEELLQAWVACDRVRQQWLSEMREYPILLCPVCAIPVFGHGERFWQIEGTRVDYLDAMRYTQWFNLLGAPAAVVPVGRSRSGLPVGVQIAGCPYDDERVLAIAGVLDREFGYQPPPLVRC